MDRLLGHRPRSERRRAERRPRGLPHPAPGDVLDVPGQPRLLRETGAMITSLKKGLQRTLAVFALVLAACSTEELLSVEDPDVINPGSVNTAAGARALFAGALGEFSFAIVG